MDSPNKNRRILVVDDTASIHGDVRATLAIPSTDDALEQLEWEVLGTKSASSTAIEYEIDSAYQGQEGLERVSEALAEGRPYALAIVDIRMPPGWDGVETITRIREIDPHLQIAICSAYSDYSWQSIHERFGTNDWLLILKKPFDTAEVQQLACAMTEKWNLARQASLKIDELNKLVEEHARQLRIANAELEQRNSSLADTNQRLSQEMEARSLADARIRHIAYHDILTELPNRAYLMERLNDCIQRSQRRPDYVFALLFMDIDDFKLVNDSLGHRVGDQLLSQVASEMMRAMRTLESSLRPSQDTVARLGGDEFVILLDDIHHAEHALRIAQSIRERVCKRMLVGEREITPGISIGVAVCHHDYSDASDIMRDADTALYHAKAMGKGKVALFDQAMHSRVRERLDLENDLNIALEHDQLELYYQPIVSLDTGQLYCLEALVRWEHPGRGLLSPDVFLPVAEQTGQIEAVSQQILQEVTRQISEWQQAFPQFREVPVSVNLSASQVIDSNLIRQIEDCFETYQLQPRSLKLELTETVMMRNLAMAQKVVDELVARGVEFYLDDFGTGYSSLSILHTLPFGAIKLDRSFISNLEEDADRQTTVQVMVMLAEHRGIQLIAEGVENSKQLDILRALGCKYAQGFYFARPAPPQQLSHLFESGRVTA